MIRILLYSPLLSHCRHSVDVVKSSHGKTEKRFLRNDKVDFHPTGEANYVTVDS